MKLKNVKPFSDIKPDQIKPWRRKEEFLISAAKAKKVRLICAGYNLGDTYLEMDMTDFYFSVKDDTLILEANPAGFEI